MPSLTTDSVGQGGSQGGLDLEEMQSCAAKDMALGKGKELGAFLKSIYHIKDDNKSGHGRKPYPPFQTSTESAYIRPRSAFPSVHRQRVGHKIWHVLDRIAVVTGVAGIRPWVLRCPQRCADSFVANGSCRTLVLPDFPSLSWGQHLIPCCI